MAHALRCNRSIFSFCQKQQLDPSWISKIRFNMLQVVADCLIKNTFKPKKAC